MSLLVGLTNRAEAEWNAAFEWWSKHRSAGQAIRWYNGVADAIESLGDNPQQWPLARENGRSVYELRERHFGLSRTPTHRILFTIRTAIVLVVSIRHVAQQDFDPDN